MAAVLTTLPTARAWAQESPPAAEPATAESDASQGVDEVIVRGRRLEDIKSDLRIHIREFIGEVVRKPPGRGFARWYRRVCIGVHNLEPSAAQYVVDRISKLALEVGLEPGEPGCAPEVNIVFATNAKETAAAMVESEPRVFRRVGGFSGMDLGLAALDDFAQSDRPVRWWHVSLPVDARTGGAAIELTKNCGEAFCPPNVNVAGPSRIHNGTRDDLLYTIIIVDATKLEGTTWQQLGDYLAVISLCQIDPRTNPGSFDSILNLFTNPRAYSGLTDWDQSYVRALYEFDQERIESFQENEIIDRIADQELQRAQ
ncbi:MAG TPA: hypothetical protein VGL98_08640 [Gammaproteobacteria bacterium]